MIDGGTINELAKASKTDVLNGDLDVHAIKRDASVEPLAIPSRRLDFLRGAAAVYVVIGHARGHLFAGGSVLTERGGLEWHDYLMLALLQLTSMGTEAVILFFVMSGFAMAHSFPRSGSNLSFYKKRIIRIWPPYLVAVAIAFLIAAVVLRSPEVSAITVSLSETRWGVRQALEMALYLRVITDLTAQFWSLPHEVIFYALCPLLLATRKRVVAFWVVSAILTGMGAISFGIYDDPIIGGNELYRHFFTLLIFFMTGAIAYHHQDRIPRINGRALLIVFLAAFVSIWFIKYHVFNGWNVLSSLLTVPIAILLIGSVPVSLYGRKWLNWGHFSYSLYVFHMQFIILIGYVLARVWSLEQPTMTSYWMWMLAVPPIIGISWLLYLGVEKRCDAALTRIRDRERAVRDDAGEFVRFP